MTSAACGLCGRDPAAGYALVGDVRYCHGDFDPDPTCYMRAQSCVPPTGNPAREAIGSEMCTVSGDSLRSTLEGSYAVDKPALSEGDEGGIVAENLRADGRRSIGRGDSRTPSLNPSPSESACPACGSEDVSGDHPQHILDQDGPDPRMVCEECGHRWVDVDVTTGRNRRERIYAAHPFGMKFSFFRRWQDDRRASVGLRVSEPPQRGAASGEGNDPDTEALREAEADA